jgi:hypothetical protein
MNWDRAKRRKPTEPKGHKPNYYDDELARRARAEMRKWVGFDFLDGKQKRKRLRRRTR